MVNQYYENSARLLDNFTGMWEYMMACFVLINTIMYTENIHGFVEKINRYNESSYYLFYFLRWFEEKLISEKIEIDKNGETCRMAAYLI